MTLALSARPNVSSLEKRPNLRINSYLSVSSDSTRTTDASSDIILPPPPPSQTSEFSLLQQLILIVGRCTLPPPSTHPSLSLLSPCSSSPFHSTTPMLRNSDAHTAADADRELVGSSALGQRRRRRTLSFYYYYSNSKFMDNNSLQH